MRCLRHRSPLASASVGVRCFRVLGIRPLVGVSVPAVVGDDSDARKYETLFSRFRPRPMPRDPFRMTLYPPAKPESFKTVLKIGVA
uniref:Uncharacterized protein n=1 Tax=Klebsiella pneumoniae TaxID=573 RepID=A0A482M726_KLEPN|nr:hypothetical protein [Klebsiella pneumoniae]